MESHVVGDEEGEQWAHEDTHKAVLLPNRKCHHQHQNQSSEIDKCRPYLQLFSLLLVHSAQDLICDTTQEYEPSYNRHGLVEEPALVIHVCCGTLSLSQSKCVSIKHVLNMLCQGSIALSF